METWLNPVQAGKTISAKWGKCGDTAVPGITMAVGCGAGSLSGQKPFSKEEEALLPETWKAAAQADEMAADVGKQMMAAVRLTVLQMICRIKPELSLEIWN